MSDATSPPVHLDKVVEGLAGNPALPSSSCAVSSPTAGVLAGLPSGRT